MQELLQYINDKDPDKVSVDLASSLDTVAKIELLQVVVMLYIAIPSRISRLSTLALSCHSSYKRM